MVELFTPEEKRDIMAAALEAVKKEAETTRRRQGLSSLDNPSERQKLRKKLTEDVVKTVRTNVVNTLLGFLPREVSAGIQFSAFSADIARRTAEALGAPAEVAAKAATAAGAFGAIAGPAFIQVQRALRRREKQRQALIESRSIFSSPEVVIGELEFDQQMQESRQKLTELGTAIATGRFDRAKDILTFILDKGRAGAAATRAFTEALAEEGPTAITFAKTAAEQEFNKQSGRIPLRIYQAFSVIHERANAEFDKFAKDPPLKG